MYYIKKKKKKLKIYLKISSNHPTKNFPPSIILFPRIKPNVKLPHRNKTTTTFEANADQRRK